MHGSEDTVQPKQTAQAVGSPRLDPRPASAPEGFADFFHSSYREVVKTAMSVGATKEEAEDAASKTMTGMLRLWPVPGHPLRYARKAVVNDFIKDKKRKRREVQLLVEHRHAPPYEGAEDGQLTELEGLEWIAGVLGQLPEEERQVMQGIADGLSREEIAETIGRSRDVVRRRLCDARARLLKILSPDGEFRQPQRTARFSREEAP